MVGYTHHPIKSFCMSLYTNKYYLTYFLDQRKKIENVWMGGGTGSPLLGIHFWVNHDWMWSWLDLVGYTQFCSFALVVWHRLQQRKLILAKNETHKKQKTQSKHRIAKNNPTRFTRKNTTKSKNKSHKNNLDKFWLFCVFLVCFFLCALVLYFLNRYILYAVRLKSLVYKKDQNKLLTVIFGSREKGESKMYERKGGQAHPSLEYIFWISGFDMIRL